MRDLATLQASMTRAIIAGSFADIENELVAGNADPARRFSIYRNNTFLSLTSHLRTVFPVTGKLGDDRFFSYAAHQFILRAPPREARLVVYGAAFPQFLQRFPACRHAPILAQMASLEWAIHCALTSAQLPYLEATELEGVTGDGRLDLQPSIRFVLSRWPVLDLWAHESERHQTLPRKASRIAVVRHDEDIRFFELTPAQFAFWRSLKRRRTVEQAALSALARDPAFNLVDEIIFLFRNRLVTGFDPARPDKGQVP